MFSTLYIDISLNFVQLDLENFGKILRDPSSFITFAKVDGLIEVDEIIELNVLIEVSKTCGCLETHSDTTYTLRQMRMRQNNFSKLMNGGFK